MPLRAFIFAAIFVGATSAPAVGFHEANACDGTSGTTGLGDLHSDNVEYVGGHNGFTGGHIFVENDILYVGSYGIGFRMYDISDPANPVCLAEIHATGIASADSVPDAAIFDGRTIVALGGTGRIEGAPVPELNTDRTDFYDVTDPENPIYLWTMGPGPEHGEAHNADIFDEERLWLPSGGARADGLRIYDMNPLLETTPQQPTELFHGDPLDLWEVSPYRDEEDEPIEDTFTHTHDITIYPDYEVEGLGPRDIILLAEGGSYLQSEPIAAGDTGSIFVIDITDPRNPVVLHRWLHPLEEEEGEDHHPIRYHHEAQFLDADPHVMLVTDEDLHSTPGCLTEAAGITAVAFSADLQSTEELSESFIPPVGPPAAVCSAHVFDSHGVYVFMGSYNAGLQIFDYSDPAAPEQAGFYIAEGATSWGAYFHEGYVYVGDVSRGLDVFRFHMPDLTVTDLTVGSEETVTAGEKVTLTATVANIGDVDVEGALLRFTANDAQIGDDQELGALAAGEDGEGSVEWDTTGLAPGEYTITATADPDGAITELDETNNSASATVTVVAPATPPPDDDDDDNGTGDDDGTGGRPRIPNTSMSAGASHRELLVRAEQH